MNKYLKYIPESDCELRESLIEHNRNSRGPLTLIVDYSTCLRTRPIDHGPISGPSEGVEAFSGFVSNRNNSMMRCRLWCALCLHIALVCNLHIPAAWHGTRVYDESQLVKLIRRSDPSSGLGMFFVLFFVLI